MPQNKGRSGFMQCFTVNYQQNFEANGICLLGSRKKKRILSEKDFSERLKFARKVKRTYFNDFFMNDISFYLDGVSFYHKYNPLNDARAPKGKIWRKRKEGLSVTAKGTQVGSVGRVVKISVTISYGKGYIYCKQYEKLDGNYYADFISKICFKRAGKVQIIRPRQLPHIELC